MVALLTVFAGLSVYDYVLVRQGRASKMVLQLPDRFKRRIHASVRRGVRGYSLVAGAAAMGFAVSIFELGCTGQVYFPTISYMVQSGGGLTGYGLLVVYNLGFIAPLLALFAAVYVGIGSDGLLRFFRANLGRLKLALAVVFVVLAGFTAFT
jgi:cytochrome c biogenesis protein CcdA